MDVHHCSSFTWSYYSEIVIQQILSLLLQYEYQMLLKGMPCSALAKHLLSFGEQSHVGRSTLQCSSATVV